MDTRSTHRWLISQPSDDRGLSSVQFLVASGLALIFFMALANVMVVQYARGSMRSALDQGVRAGVVNGSIAACEERIHDVAEELIGGTIGETLSFDCRVTGSMMTAVGTLRVESWTPFTADFDVAVEAGATLEPNV